jgi:hypothetical protein
MSNNLSIKSGSVDNILRAVAFTDDDAVKTDLAFDTPGISIFIQRIGQDDGTPLTLSAKASPGASHSDGAFLNLGRGDFSVDAPDAPFATYKGQLRLNGTFTGGYIVGVWFDVVGFDPSLEAVGANTVAPLNSAQTQSAAAAAISDADLVTTSMLAGGNVKPSVRAVDDTTPVRFIWPTSGETITVERSINAGAFEAATGTISFFRTEGTDHWYKLAYNVADRAIGIVRYKLTDGTITRYLTLQVEPAGGLDAPGIRGAVGLATNNLDTQLSGISSKTTNLPASPAAVGSEMALIDNAITDAKIATNAITAAKLAANSITATTLADNAITANKIASNAITSAKIAASAIGASQIASNAITDAKINAGAITSAKFAAAAITSTVLADNAITAAKIAAAAFNDKGNWNIGKTGYVLTQGFPANFASLGINESGHISRVVLVDTTTTNTDMRGTDNALLAANYTSPSNSDISAIKSKTDQLTFTVAGFLDANLYRWRGTQPGTLDSNGFVPSNTAAINGNTTAVSTFRTALDNNYFAKLNVSGTLAHTDNANLFKADVSNLSADVNVVEVNGVPVNSIDDFKADVSMLATLSDLEALEQIIAGIEVEVDFTEILESLSQINTKISSTTIQILSPLDSTGTVLTVIQGDDYLVADGRNILFTIDTENQWNSLTNANVVFGVYGTNILKECVVISGENIQQISLELTAEETNVPQGTYDYDVQATLENGSVVTLFRGKFISVKSYTN